MDSGQSAHTPLTNNFDQNLAAAIFVLVLVAAVLWPGAAIGAGITFLVWRATPPDNLLKWLFALAGATTVGVGHAPLATGWLWGVTLATLHLPVVLQSAATIEAAVRWELLLGPALLIGVELGQTYWNRTIGGQEWARYREVASRKKALERHWPGPGGIDTDSTATAHPDGLVRLGVQSVDGHPFDLDATELAQHVFIPGGSGSGKTNTLTRLADGALAAGYGVVIIDCKGSGLGASARGLATTHHVPLTIVDPHDPKSVGYDPCSGDAAMVANKLVGAFQFSGEAEIYKQIAMEVIPVICRAMAASGTDITLDALYDALAKGGLARLGRKDGADAFRDRLEQLDESGGVGAAGYIGLQKRLGALREGVFGDLFARRPALDWREKLRRPAVVYLSLSATAAGEDVELFGRVITQDLKQLCDERMRLLDRGGSVVPVLVIYDEFAALREATQIVDLLLQARQAKMPLVVATQFLPEEPSIRKPVMSAGVLIVHRLEAEDAETTAAQFGTHTTPMLTNQIDYETGTSEKGSVRYVEEFNIHPNELKQLPVGMAAVYARRSNRRSLVQVHRVT